MEAHNSRTFDCDVRLTQTRSPVDLDGIVKTCCRNKATMEIGSDRHFCRFAVPTPCCQKGARYMARPCTPLFPRLCP